MLSIRLPMPGTCVAPCVVCSDAAEKSESAAPVRWWAPSTPWCVRNARARTARVPHQQDSHGVHGRNVSLKGFLLADNRHVVHNGGRRLAETLKPETYNISYWHFCEDETLNCTVRLLPGQRMATRDPTDRGESVLHGHPRCRRGDREGLGRVPPSSRPRGRSGAWRPEESVPRGCCRPSHSSPGYA